MPLFHYAFPYFHNSLLKFFVCLGRPIVTYSLGGLRNTSYLLYTVSLPFSFWRVDFFFPELPSFYSLYILNHSYFRSICLTLQTYILGSHDASVLKLSSSSILYYAHCLPHPSPRKGSVMLLYFFFLYLKHLSPRSPLYLNYAWASSRPADNTWRLTFAYTTFLQCFFLIHSLYVLEYEGITTFFQVITETHH